MPRQWRALELSSPIPPVAPSYGTVRTAADLAANLGYRVSPMGVTW